MAGSKAGSKQRGTARTTVRARRPVRVRARRSAADAFFGLIAVAFLLAVLGGVPFGLVTVLGLPVPRNLPPMSDFTHQLDVVAVLRILSVVAWLAWLQLAVCVLVEIGAAIRGVGLPSRVPLSGRTQAFAHWLVSAALLLFSAGTAIAPVLLPPGHTRAPAPQSAAIAFSRPASVVPAGTTPAGATSPEPVTAYLTSADRPSPQVQARPADGHATRKIYIVQPPEGRHHDSLWEIAQRHLGDGRRYREIFELNSGRVQPDGATLTIASLIRPGWILDMPHDATGPGIRLVHEQETRPPTAHRRAHAAQPRPGASARASSAPSQAGTPSGAVRTHHGGPPPQQDEQHGAPGASAHPAAPLLPYELSAAALLAAGVLAALGRRRREQLWHRAFGRRIALPEGEAAAAETALRLGADQEAVQALDTGLRHMSRTLAGQGRRPPAVFAAFIGRRQLDLWLCRADADAPPPWTAEEEGMVWRLPLSSVPSLAQDEAGAALAPYPGLVSIGSNDDGRVLIDPGAAGGVISLRGPAPLVRGALAALAVELATSSWSDRMRLTLVGFGTELTLLAPERVTVARTLDEVLPAMEARAAEMAQALAASAAGPGAVGDPGEPYWGPYWVPPASRRGEPGSDRDSGSARGDRHGQPPDVPEPHYVLAGIQPTPDQAERLRRLARARYGVAAGCVVAGEMPGAAWTLDITGDGRLRADELGLDLAAQLVPDQQYTAIVELFRTATRTIGPALPPAELFAAPITQLAADHRSAVEIRLLGPVTVDAPGPIESARRGSATELVVYVATHPEGVHPAVLTAALWPRGAPGEVVEAAIARVREWLGTDDVGRPNLGADVSGRLRLGSQVRVDWQVFRALIARAIRAPDDAGRGQLLAQALELVRGPLLEGRERARYTWLATDGFEADVAAWVADTAHQLAGMRLAVGDAEGAMDAARRGLGLAGGDEMLWRDLLRAAHATGWEHVLRDVVRELSARVAIDPVLPRMAPETEALIDELLPSWRTSAA